MKEKIVKYFNLGFLPALMIFALIAILVGSWDRALYFIALYAVCFIGDRLLDIKKSLDMIWYRMYKRNQKDGLE
ncbi:hypothetical protein [Enterococcus sp. AZ109]|uniref:hypothetical protein n=1 Tax=Enterococcus sp. AZ109 TaxID=2774634 RepID=UPI003F215030